ncbi:MAG: hypothetical protein NC820_00610 [Candidatus Omnitrophica bacterium]|nr:hypothetical protein [Candidatus Omnitrophota bacterium]
MRKPVGILILGWINFLFFGLFNFFVNIYTLFNLKTDHLIQINEILLKKSLPQLTYPQLRAANIFNIFLSFIFLLSGLGILLRKRWGYKLTVYFSFFWIIFVFLIILINPAIFKHLFLHILYPGILILYFTNKRIWGYFNL